MTGNISNFFYLFGNTVFSSCSSRLLSATKHFMFCSLLMDEHDSIATLNVHLLCMKGNAFSHLIRLSSVMMYVMFTFVVCDLELDKFCVGACAVCSDQTVELYLLKILQFACIFSPKVTKCTSWLADGSCLHTCSRPITWFSFLFLNSEYLTTAAKFNCFCTVMIDLYFIFI
jgi:hypothetical protein